MDFFAVILNYLLLSLCRFFEFNFNIQLSEIIF
jgi:hypothetical protein